MEIDEPDQGLWTFHQPLTVLGAHIGTRMTVVRLASGALFVHSPIRLTLSLRERLGELGAVEHVLAPNLDHYLFIAEYHEAFPSARLYAAPGVAAKLPDVRFDVQLAPPATVGAWEDTVDVRYFRSSSELQEVVLLHRATRTVISSDLSFNIQGSEGLLSKVMLRLNDSYKTFGPSRVCRSHITAPSMARADVDAIVAWSPERLIVAHGEILRSGAAEALRRAYAFLP